MTNVIDYQIFPRSLHIEVASSETAAHLNKKISLHLAHGGKSVWVVFPEPRHVRILHATGQSKTFEHQLLEDPNMPHGFSAPVSSFFEG
ncbi:MAG TPA: Uma2 family endonuclease [Bryobacteraceae bacterium]|nr:Uma2 family endonuclease [Bryobacteraceae bacterium]